jgi:hypothetical protein
MFCIVVAHFISGCSLLVRSGGTYEASFFREGVTRETVQQQLGEPILTKQFNTPTYFEEVPELKPIVTRLGRYRGMLVAFREDFRYRGWIRENGDNDGYGMLAIMTAGLSEIILFPQSIVARVADSFKLHTFQVWFSPDGYYIYHRRINEIQQ